MASCVPLRRPGSGSRPSKSPVLPRRRRLPPEHCRFQAPAGVGGVSGVWFSSAVALGHGISRHRLIFSFCCCCCCRYRCFELNQMSRQAVLGRRCRRRVRKGRWRWRTAASRADRNNNGIVRVRCGLVAFDGHLSAGGLGEVAGVWMGRRTGKRGLRAWEAPQLKCSPP